MRIQFGTLDETLGYKVTEGEWTFLACIGRTEGDSFGHSHRLAEHIDVDRAPLVLRDALAELYDGAWVRARLPHVFGYEPSASNVEKTLFSESFVAVKENCAFVFCCADYYGQSGLFFSDRGHAPIKDAIARAFWSLLLREPEALAPFSVRVYHPGAGVWLNYACQDGEVSLVEESEAQAPRRCAEANGHL